VREADPPVLDERVLAELNASVQGDRTFVVELIQAYLADGPAHVDAIEAAVTADDAAALVRPAHTLKSSSATVGASRLAATSRRLEMAGRDGVLGGEVRASAEALRGDWEAAAGALRAWIDDGGGE
jgi:HPt (histidine-containing phosphotransfer) domain-containing protein